MLKKGTLTKSAITDSIYNHLGLAKTKSTEWSEVSYSFLTAINTGEILYRRLC